MKFQARLFAILVVAYLFLFGYSSWRAAQVPEEGRRLPIMESMPTDSSKVDTTVTQPQVPNDPDTVLPPP